MTLYGATDDLDGVVADLFEQCALAALVVGPLKGGHLNDLKRVAGPPAYELMQVIDLAAPLGELPLGQRHRTGFRPDVLGFVGELDPTFAEYGYIRLMQHVARDLEIFGIDVSSKRPTPGTAHLSAFAEAVESVLAMIGVGQ